MSEQPHFFVTLPCWADYTSYQFSPVYIYASAGVGYAKIAGAAASNCIGVLQDDPNTKGYVAQVMTEGISKVKYGGSVTVGDNLKTDGAGGVVTAGGDDPVVGVAWESGSQNDIGSMFIVNGANSGIAGAAPLIPMIPIELASITTAADLVTAIPVPVDGQLVSLMVYCSAADSKSSKAATIYLKKNTSAITNSDTPLASATLTAGAVANPTSPMTATTVTTSDTITISAKTVTSFAGSTGRIWVGILTSN